MTLTSRPLLAAIVAAALGSSAMAQPSAPQVSQRYSFDGQHVLAQMAIPLSDLDLGSPAGVRTLFDRIQAAADLVCAGGAQLASVEAACRAQAVRDAVARAGSPALSELAAQDAPRP